MTHKPTDNSPYASMSNPQKSEQIAKVMMKNWELTHEIVTNRGGKFVAVLQPAFMGVPKTDHLVLDVDLGKNFKSIYRQVKKKIAERNHPWIYDLSHKFDGNEFIYIDFCHVSPNGNQIIANEIVTLVNKMEE